MADELDRKMLKLLSAGKTNKAVAAATGQKESNVAQRKRFYVEQSIFDPQSRAVDWPQFEVIDPPARRGTGGGTSTPAKSKPGVQNQAPASPDRAPAGGLTAEEIEVLKAFVEERTQAAESKRSNTPVDAPTSIRPDSGLWTALRAWAKEQGVTYTEAVNRAIEALLRAV